MRPRPPSLPFWAPLPWSSWECSTAVYSSFLVSRGSSHQGQRHFLIPASVPWAIAMVLCSRTEPSSGGIRGSSQLVDQFYKILGAIPSGLTWSPLFQSFQGSFFFFNLISLDLFLLKIPRVASDRYRQPGSGSFTNSPQDLSLEKYESWRQGTFR